MSEETISKAPRWFWVVAWIALLWNLLGVFAYLGQALMPAEALAQLPADQQQLMQNTPAWATAAFAVAVWGGAIASILLLLKKKMAKMVFIVSFVGIIIQLIHSLFMSNSIEVYGPGGMVMPIMVFGFGIFLIWLSDKATKESWIG